MSNIFHELKQSNHSKTILKKCGNPTSLNWHCSKLSGMLWTVSLISCILFWYITIVYPYSSSKKRSRNAAFQQPVGASSFQQRHWKSSVKAIPWMLSAWWVRAKKYQNYFLCCLAPNKKADHWLRLRLGISKIIHLGECVRLIQQIWLTRNLVARDVVVSAMATVRGPRPTNNAKKICALKKTKKRLTLAEFNHIAYHFL